MNILIVDGNEKEASDHYIKLVKKLKNLYENYSYTKLIIFFTFINKIQLQIL